MIMMLLVNGAVILHLCHNDCSATQLYVQEVAKTLNKHARSSPYSGMVPSVGEKAGDRILGESIRVLRGVLGSSSPE